MRNRHLFPALVVACACATQTDKPVRSPARDYRPEPPRTADGQVLGADGKDPGALLEESGTTDHAAPGWTLDDEGLKYNPSRPAGHSDEAAIPEHKDGHGGTRAK
jgi:hypothetical protein